MSISLRVRLLISYLLLLALTLGVTTLALLLILVTRPASPQPTYQRLAAVAQVLPLRDILLEANNNSLFLSTRERIDLVLTQFTDLAEERNIRIMVVNQQAEVLYDSSGVFGIGDVVPLETEPYTLPAAIRRGFSSRVETLFGSFNDPSGDWLFVGLGTSTPTNQRAGALLFADVHERQSFEQAWTEFRQSLALPLIQATLVGLVVAVMLAFYVSRNIARPLQRVAIAAAQVAKGDFGTRVPVSGPPEVGVVAATFNHMTEQVQATQRAQRDFMANVSHDLKTPLTSIQGYSQAIIDGAAANPVGAAQIIYEEAGRLNRMVTELTDLARLQAGRMSMHMTTLDLAPMVEGVSERLKIVALEKGIHLRLQVRPVPSVMGDGDRLAQVLVNLISNAIKYTPANGQVWVETRAVENGVEVSVRDTGIGIPESELPRIFERFYQVDRARGPRRGTGLGLAIVQEIVQAHGGKITVSSRGEGFGATFTLWLPSPQATTIIRRR